jgi:glycosyltransferase involved in cell wall biosynthesis
VPTYNGARYLPLLCESVQGQTCGDFEALIWNDGSTDNTMEAVAPFLKDSRFRLMGMRENRGLNASWRELLKRARGEFWCSPGADDIFFSDFLERRISRLRAEPNAALVHGRPIYIDAAGDELKEKYPEVYPDAVQPGEDALPALLEHNYVNQPSVLARTTTTLRVLAQWSNEWKYAPDWHLWILHAATGQKFLYDMTPVHQYRVHLQSLSGQSVHAATRLAETRLVPMCALAQAVTLSTFAAHCWGRWRSPMYALWLRRAFKLHRMRRLEVEWMNLGALAYYGNNLSAPVIHRECARHALRILVGTIREACARRRNSFEVAGLAQIGNALFH